MNLDDPNIRAELMGKLSASVLDDENVRNDLLARLREASSTMGVATDVLHSGAEGFNAGLANAVDTYVNKPVESLINLGGSAVNALSGALGYGDVVPNVTVPKVRQTTDALGLSDRTATTTAGRYAQSVGEGVGQALPFAAVGPVAGAMAGAGARATAEAAAGTVAQNLAVGAGSGAGQQVAKDAGAPEWVGALAGGLAGQAGATAAAKAVNGTTGQIFRDYVDAGVTPRLAGDVAPGVAQRVQAALGAVGYRDIIGAARQQVDDLARAVDGVAPTRAATIDDAGAALIEGANKFRSAWKDESTRLYGQFDNLLPADTRVAVDNTLDVLTGGSRQFPDAPNMAARFESPLFRGLLDDLGADAGTGTISFKSLQSARSKVGERLSSPALVTDADRADLNRLYGALSADIEAAAKTAGPDAAEAFAKASGHYKAGLGTINDDLKPLLRDNATSVQAYNYAMGEATKGVDRLASLKAAMPQDEWNTFVSSEIRRLGAATPGNQNAAADAFSPATFLTNYAKLQKSGAADVMFQGDMKVNLDRIARVAESMKSSQKFWNHSNTAGTNFILGLGGSIVGGGGAGAAVGIPGAGAITAALTFGAGKVGAMLWSNPRFVKWLATSAEDTAMTNRGFLNGVARFAVQSVGNDPDAMGELQKKLDDAWDYLSKPTDDYLDKLNQYAASRTVPRESFSDPRRIIDAVAQRDPQFARELAEAAERSPTAFKGLLYQGMRDQRRKEVVESALGVNKSEQGR